MMWSRHANKALEILKEQRNLTDQLGLYDKFSKG